MSKQQRTAVHLVRLAGLVFTGLFAGMLTTVLVLELSLRDYGGQVYAQVREVELDSLDFLASLLLVPAIVAMAFVVWRTARARDRSFWLTVTGLALLVGVFVLTLAVNMPINTEQGDWNVQAPPSDWAALRDRWQVSHAVRTVAAGLAFLALSVATLRRSVVAGGDRNGREPAVPVTVGRRP
ncbi:DUF1772 domain-containing protein [Streptomyces sp. T-3]|nr:DUF1772 domain-containing protein [Streptomyces sp. T-3]